MSNFLYFAVSEVCFRDVPVTKDDRLGTISDGLDIMGEVMAAKNITYAAAVTGFMRSLIGKELFIGIFSFSLLLIIH